MCRSVMKLLPPNAHVKAERSVSAERISQPIKEKNGKLCGSKVSMVFQDPMLTLNPTIPVGKQITEAIIKIRKYPGMRRKKSCGNAEAGRDSGCRTALWPTASFFPEECVSVVCWLLHWPVIRKYYLPMRRLQHWMQPWKQRFWICFLS